MPTPLVLISGLLSNTQVWEHQIKHLSGLAPVQVISPDQDSAEKMVEMILQEAPPVFALAGHSMGGWLCLEVLRADPSRVVKVCLLNTSARDDSEEKKEKRRAMIAQAENGGFNALAEKLAEIFVENPVVRKKAKEMFLGVGPEAFVNQEKAMLGRASCEPVLGTVRCPALVVHAAKDRNFTLEEHEELVRKIPGAKFALVEDSGHMSPMEAPQAVTALLRYWLTYFY